MFPTHLSSAKIKRLSILLLHKCTQPKQKEALFQLGLYGPAQSQVAEPRLSALNLCPFLSSFHPFILLTILFIYIKKKFPSTPHTNISMWVDVWCLTGTERLVLIEKHRQLCLSFSLSLSFPSRTGVSLYMENVFTAQTTCHFLNILASISGFKPALSLMRSQQLKKYKCEGALGPFSVNKIKSSNNQCHVTCLSLKLVLWK